MTSPSVTISGKAILDPNNAVIGFACKHRFLHTALGSRRNGDWGVVVSTALRHREPSVALQRYSALRLGASKGGKLAKDALQYALQLAHMRTNASDEVAKMEAAACVIQHHYRRWSERSGR